MATVLQLESEAFAYGEEEFSDVELVFVQEQPDLSEQVEAVPLSFWPAFLLISLGINLLSFILSRLFPIIHQLYSHLFLHELLVPRVDAQSYSSHVQGPKWPLPTHFPLLGPTVAARLRGRRLHSNSAS